MLVALPAFKKLIADFDFQEVLGCSVGGSKYIEQFRSADKRWHDLDLALREPDGEATFDCIWVSECLERHPSPIDVLAMLRKALRPGGVIAVTVPHVHNDVRGGEINLYTAGHLLHQMVLAGFDCSDALVRTYGPTVSILLRHIENQVLLDMDGRLGRTFQDVAPFMPPSCRLEGFNGRIDSINWRCLTLYGKTAEDFTDTARGSEIMLCGGHPSIRDQSETINRLDIPKAVMNNTGTLIQPDIWFGLDTPASYEQRLLTDPIPLKIGRLNYPRELVAGKPWKDHPNTWFISDVKNEQEGDWLNEGALIWFKDSFKLAIQFLYRMGYRRIYLAGCGFNQPGHYAYGFNEEVVTRNSRLYGNSVEWLRANQRYFLDNGLELVNCTPGSAADFLPAVDLADLAAR